MTAILALDPGQRMGWCAGLNDHGIIDLGDGEQSIRDAKLLECVGFMLAKKPYDLLAMEGAAISRHGWGMDRLAGYRGIIRAVASSRGVPVAEVNIKTLKKWATNNGNANKDQMIRALKTMYGIEVEDDNEADAIWIWNYVSSGQFDIAEKLKANTPQEKKKRWNRGDKPKQGRMF